MSEADATIYAGSCHCGAVQFEVETALDSLGDCNCSRCSRLGWVMQSVLAAQFRLKDGEDKLTAYRFNTEKIEHLFCSVCGIESFARGSDSQGNQVFMINVTCLDGVEVDRNKLHHWDGKSF